MSESVGKGTVGLRESSWDFWVGEYPVKALAYINARYCLVEDEGAELGGVVWGLEAGV